jgi:hypothetical protein
MAEPANGAARSLIQDLRRSIKVEVAELNRTRGKLEAQRYEVKVGLEKVDRELAAKRQMLSLIMTTEWQLLHPGQAASQVRRGGLRRNHQSWHLTWVAVL